jgi:ribonuclease P protein component
MRRRPRDWSSMKSGDETREADLSAEQTGAQAPTRFSRPHGDERRPQGDQYAARAPPQAAERVTGCQPGIAPIQRIRQRSDFVSAAAGTKVPSAAFVLQARERGDAGPPRFGFTVTKKVGTAVERNRVRRRLRDIVRRSAADRLRSGNDYVLIGRRAALNLPFDRLMRDFLGTSRR